MARKWRVGSYGLCMGLAFVVGVSVVDGVAPQPDFERRANGLLQPLYTTLDRALTLNLIGRDDYDLFREKLRQWVRSIEEEQSGRGGLSEGERQGLLEQAERIRGLIPFLLRDVLTYEAVFEKWGPGRETMNLLVQRLRRECEELGDRESRERWIAAVEAGGGMGAEALNILEEGGDCFSQMNGFVEEVLAIRDRLDREIDRATALVNATTARCEATTDALEKRECEREEAEQKKELTELVEVRNPPIREQVETGGGRDCGFLGLGCILKFAFGSLFYFQAVGVSILTGSTEPVERWSEEFLGTGTRTETRMRDGGVRTETVRVLGEEVEEAANERVAADLREADYEEVNYRAPDGGKVVVSVYRNAEEIRLYLGSREYPTAVFKHENTDVMNNAQGVDSVLDLRSLAFSGEVFDTVTFTTTEGEETRSNRLNLSGEAVGPDGRRLRFTLGEAEVASGSFRLTVEEE